jgi:hypothetical protein
MGIVADAAELVKAVVHHLISITTIRNILLIGTLLVIPTPWLSDLSAKICLVVATLCGYFSVYILDIERQLHRGTAIPLFHPFLP